MNVSLKDTMLNKSYAELLACKLTEGLQRTTTLYMQSLCVANLLYNYMFAALEKLC